MSLRIGDRIPNFQLPSKDGLKRIFYFELNGGVIILLVARGPAAAINDCFTELRSCMEVINGFGGQVFGVTDNISKVKENLSSSIIFEDKEGRLSDLLLSGSDAKNHNLKLLVLDPNQRVLVQFPISDPKQDIHASINALKRLLDAPQPPCYNASIRSTCVIDEQPYRSRPLQSSYRKLEKRSSRRSGK
ncbi:MAG: hypothetical protein ACJZ2I_01160 [Thalassobaculaceae bacterium]